LLSQRRRLASLRSPTSAALSRANESHHRCMSCRRSSKPGPGYSWRIVPERLEANRPVGDRIPLRGELGVGRDSSVLYAKGPNPLPRAASSGQGVNGLLPHPFSLPTTAAAEFGLASG
jgi:hypothetical protein